VIGWAKIKADGTVFDCFNCDELNTFYLASAGTYQVGFNFYLAGSPRTAVLDTQTIGTTGGEIAVADRSGDNYALWINTQDSAGARANRPFTVFIYNW
jgi:hypothetical protein